jgi:hypothetical protein
VCLGLLLFALSVVFRSQWLAVAGVASIVLVIVRSMPLHRFFFRKRGLLFAFVAVGLHLLYYLTAAVSVAWGAMLTIIIGEPRPDPSVEAFSELNLAAWPPVPKNPSKQPIGSETVDL